MSRTNRALTTLALSLALVATTAAVAAATPPTGITNDLSGQREALYQSELEHNQAAQAASTQAAVERARAGERNLAAAQPVAEDQSDRLLRGIETARAERTQAAVEQVRAGERSLDPAPVVTIAPRPVPAATGRGVDPLAVLLLGLVGGLVGGAAAAAGWTASHRRTHGAVAA